ncbi:MAG: hypothetical protein K0S86_3500 [Geminicoccaceae bacterium]|nr:hypothetical protein [Geminicoccaceae bacterium]
MALRLASHFALIALVSVPLHGASGQERSSIPPPLPTDWLITFGVSSGRFHENAVRYTVADHGQIAYTDRRGATPAVGSISPETIRELTSLVDRLRLSEASRIPSSRFNACIVSQHLPNVWFSLKRGPWTHSLSHCNTVERGARPSDEYTLALDDEQRAVYTTLRSKLEALFTADLRSKVGTRQQTAGDALSGPSCDVPSRANADTTNAKPRTQRLGECRPDHACALVAPQEIRRVTGRNDVASYGPEKRQSPTTSDCVHQDFVVSVRLVHEGRTAERLEAQREQAVRAGHRVERFSADGGIGYLVSHAPMVATTGPFTGETVFMLVGAKLLAISVQTFPEDYLELPDRTGNSDPWRGSVIPLAMAAAARLRR